MLSLHDLAYGVILSEVLILFGLSSFGVFRGLIKGLRFRVWGLGFVAARFASLGHSSRDWLWRNSYRTLARIPSRNPVSEQKCPTRDGPPPSNREPSPHIGTHLIPSVDCRGLEFRASDFGLRV